MLAAGIIRGYLLYRLEKSDRPLHAAGNVDASANVACSLAAFEEGLVVSERLASRVEKLGLKQLRDVREQTEAWCLNQHEFARNVLGTADPKTRPARSLMIAMRAFICSGRGSVYRKALARCDEDSPVLGWGCDSEDGQTIPSSAFGLFQTATNWCHSLPLFASDRIGHTVPAEDLRHRHLLHWSALDWGDDAHFVNFTITDGDNVQWMMGNFTGGSEAKWYYAHPKRGTIPFGWGVPVPSLCQLSPRTLAEILARATPKDDFIVFQAGGYFFPDVYNKARGSTRALELHADRLRGYMELTGIRVLAFNFQDWDSPDALAACQVFASRLPGLLGILAFQYYPYCAGNGAIQWVPGQGTDEVPIVSCRMTIWAQTGRPRDTTPASVAAQLNVLPVANTKASDNCFSWVMAHAWSRFCRAEKGAPLDAEEKGVSQEKDTPGSVRGYEPAVWAAERLRPQVRTVGVQELLMRIRMRLRPRATLSQWLAEVESSSKVSESSGELFAAARKLLPDADRDASAARDCLELLKKVRAGS
jgi:hypothetical protein